MTKNPVINAVAALAYITLVASIMFYGKRHPGPDTTVLIPIAMLSLVTLSAAVMGYIFVSQPLRLYLDGEKPAAVKLFLQTLGAFAVITIIALGLMISGVFS